MRAKGLPIYSLRSTGGRPVIRFLQSQFRETNAGKRCPVTSFISSTRSHIRRDSSKRFTARGKQWRFEPIEMIPGTALALAFNRTKDPRETPDRKSTRLN